jgi:hypothetical protein
MSVPRVVVSVSGYDSWLSAIPDCGNRVRLVWNGMFPRTFVFELDIRGLR